MDDYPVPTRPPLPPRLLLFDGARLEVDGRPVDTPLPGLRLLAYLALHGPVARSTAAGSLWPESTEEHALGSLRTAMWRLRGTGHPLFVCRRDRLELPASLWVDAQVIARLADGLSEDRASIAEADLAAVRPIRGDLLSGWYDDWVLVQRERFRQLRVHLLEAASARLLERERFAAALDLALEVVESEPLRESGHCAVIAVHLAEGNYAEALQAFRSYRSLVSAELGIGPSPRMLALMRPPPLLPTPRPPGTSASLLT